MDKQYDSLVEKIPTLNWYPWIGSEYQKTKLLIIGESHYEDGDEWQLGNKNATRTIINKRYNGENGIWKLHRNVEKILLNKGDISEVDTQNVWTKVSYWNLVQRLLDSRNIDDRPTFEDFIEGWKTFFQVQEIIKPKYCIVLGKASFGSLGHLMANDAIGWKIIKSQEIDGEVIHQISNGFEEITLLFINHPSGSFGFSPDKWASIVKSSFEFDFN